jgi:hypothetical protein
MTAASLDRNTLRRTGEVFEFGVKAATKIYAGTLVVLDTANSNLAVPGKTGTGLVCVGVAQEFTDNSAGANGDIKVRVFRGPDLLHRFGNASAGDLITLADINANAYLVDDSTVAKTSGSSTRSVAGVIRDVDGAGVWIEI